MEQFDQLNPKQKQQVLDAFKLQDQTALSDEDQRVLREMFDTPDKLVLLRKVLGVLTNAEKGLHQPKYHTATNSDFEEYGKAVLIENAVDERIRGRLWNLYLLIKQDAQSKLTAEFEQANEEALDEEERREKHKQEQEDGEKTLGENL